MATKAAVGKHAATTRVCEFYDTGKWIGQSIIRIYRSIPDGTVAHVQYFQIEFSKRGRGLGRKCYTEMEQTLRNEGVDMIELMPIDSVLGFWEKMGYNTRCGKMLEKYIKGVTS
jgi:GNAT superfamily N-acetyltransferase